LGVASNDISNLTAGGATWSVGGWLSEEEMQAYQAAEQSQGN